MDLLSLRQASSLLRSNVHVLFPEPCVCDWAKTSIPNLMKFGMNTALQGSVSCFILGPGDLILRSPRSNRSDMWTQFGQLCEHFEFDWISRSLSLKGHCMFLKLRVLDWARSVRQSLMNLSVGNLTSRLLGPPQTSYSWNLSPPPPLFQLPTP